MRLETTIGDDFREYADDPERLQQAITAERDDLTTLREKLANEPDEVDRTRLGRVLNRLADHLRLAGQHDDARRCCDEAIAIWEDFDRHRAAFLARLRRATIDFHAGALHDAHRRADELVRRSQDEPFALYHDFALELRGRIHATRGDYDQAHKDLFATLELRREWDRDRLAARTDVILDIVNEADA